MPKDNVVTWGKRPSTPTQTPKPRKVFRTTEEFVHWVEPGERIGLDLPLDLHTRLNDICSDKGTYLSKLIEETLEAQFPAPQGQGSSSSAL